MSCGTHRTVAASLRADISNIRWTLERLSIELGLHSSGAQNHHPISMATLWLLWETALGGYVPSTP
jgi:hypothetical protein